MWKYFEWDIFSIPGAGHFNYGDIIPMSSVRGHVSNGGQQENMKSEENLKCVKSALHACFIA